MEVHLEFPPETLVIAVDGNGVEMKAELLALDAIRLQVREEFPGGLSHQQTWEQYLPRYVQAINERYGTQFTTSQGWVLLMKVSSLMEAFKKKLDLTPGLPTATDSTA